MSAVLMQKCTECGCIVQYKNDTMVYHIESIPFKTKRKIEHYQCTNRQCGETYLPPGMTNILSKEMTVGQKFLAEQDKMYSSYGVTGGPHAGIADTIKCEACNKFNNLHNTKSGYCQYCHVSLPMFVNVQYFEPPTSAKRWFYGYIKYMAHVEWSPHPTLQTESFILYANEQDVSAFAMKQFTLPPNGIKTVGLKYASF